MQILNEINLMWADVDSDPKLDTFIKLLKKDNNLKDNKLIVFTESKETGEYLEAKLNLILS